MAFIDYYKILGVNRNATEKEIKKAYRKMARKYHPDVNPNDKQAEKKFKEVNEANEVLGNAENRKKYDAYGKDWKHAEQFEKAKQQRSRSTGHRSSDSQGSPFDEHEFSDFFESMFGAGARRSRSSQRGFRGQDFYAELELPLSEVLTDHKRTITVNGKNIRLTIPAGVRNGQVIKIKGYGGEGMNGGPKGDLKIKFNITNDTPYRVDDANLHMNYDLDLYTALLGGEVIVNTIGGKVKLKVPPETNNGTKVKLKGKGLPIYKKEGQFGDLFVTYSIKIPERLSDRERTLFKELAELRRT